MALRILVIDDHLLLAEALRRMLERDAHHVLIAPGGRAGIAAFRAAHRARKSFDVVIADFSMPDIDGLEVAATVKQISHATSVILITAHNLGGDERPAHVDAVLVKPPTADEVRAAIAFAAGQSPVT
jgi:CheY-like chemotaxis protein